MKNNKKGAALMQVLLITIILAGIATMILRATLSRTTSARKTRRAVSGQVLVQACMAEVNALWSKKTPEAFRRDMNEGTMYYNTAGSKVNDYTCTIQNPYNTSLPPYKVRAYFDGGTVNSGGMRSIVYEVTQGSENL